MPSHRQPVVALALALLAALLIAPLPAGPALADPAGDAAAASDRPGLEESWRYHRGEPLASPDTNADAPIPADKGKADGGADVGPRALNFQVHREGSTYVATFGGGTMTVTNATAFGVDVSEHNGTIDWNRAKAAGVDYAILRLGWGTFGETGAYGASSSDATFARNYREAKAAGVKVGVYLYSYAGWNGSHNVAYWTDYAQREADHVLTVLNQQGITPADLDYPVYYDLEEQYLERPILSFSGEQIANRTFLANIASIFCNRIGEAGYQTGVYANLNWWNNYLTDPVFNAWEKWVARYPGSGSPNQTSLYNGEHGMWQAHAEAYVDGIGTCDIDFDYLQRDGGGGTETSPEGSMFRLYNPHTGAHHYTTDAQERQGLTRLGWSYEGIAWQSPTSGTPVYRLYNPHTSDHHYTTNPTERASLIDAGWSDEGIGFYSDGKTPVYRLFNPHLTVGAHHYTASEQERDELVGLGWTYESIAFIAL